MMTKEEIQEKVQEALKSDLAVSTLVAIENAMIAINEEIHVFHSAHEDDLLETQEALARILEAVAVSDA